MGIIKLITIIGTRPQYIKLKPFYDYCKSNNIQNYIIDTNQHYSDNVSKNIKEELKLETDCNLGIEYDREIVFISNGIVAAYDMISKLSIGSQCVVIVMGDTNSSLVSAVAAKKAGAKLVHIEAGIRCHDFNSPEEFNRILVDSISDIHFTSRVKDSNNVSNPVYIGDLEYNFLNSIELGYEDISYDGPILMTIHRQENMFKNKLEEISNFCEEIKYPVIFSIHHRTEKFVNDNKIAIPGNVEIVEPMSYFEIIKIMRTCRGIITDSGGITKTAPFFGKKCIVPMDKWEWDEVFENGYAINKLDLHWFDDYKIERDMNLYYVENSCEIIVNKILEK